MTRPADHVRMGLSKSRGSAGVGSDQGCLKYHGTGRVGSDRVGSGVFEISRDGSGQVRRFFTLAGRDGLSWLHLTREQPCEYPPTRVPSDSYKTACCNCHLVFRTNRAVSFFVFIFRVVGCVFVLHCRVLWLDGATASSLPCFCEKIIRYSLVCFLSAMVKCHRNVFRTFGARLLILLGNAVFFHLPLTMKWQGTLSSYGYCVTVVHFLIRIGAVPCLLKVRCHTHKLVSFLSHFRP